MICYVDLAHPFLLADPARRQAHLGQRLAVALRLEELAGVPCLYRHYQRVDAAFVRRYGVRALVLSGISAHWRAYDWRSFATLAALARAGETPILGLCGGHLVLGRALGATVGRLGRASGAEGGPADYMPGWRKEWGFLPVEVVRENPLFASLGPRPVFRFAHGRMLKTLPTGALLLARSSACPVQAFQLADAPVWGVQFHPELYDEAHPDGRMLLATFFTLAGAGARGLR